MAHSASARFAPLPALWWVLLIINSAGVVYSVSVVASGSPGSWLTLVASGSGVILCVLNIRAVRRANATRSED